MKISKTQKAILFSAILFGFFTYAESSMAKTDLSITETDITFSKDSPLDGDLVRVYARVFNIGDSDVSGHVVFFSDGKELAGPQPISLKPNTYDDVFIDWKVKTGTHGVEAKITGLNPPDDNVENNKTIKKDFFVDLDTDGDSIGDTKDADIDGDELTNEEEKIMGTNPLKTDTDKDGINDKIDAFPSDKTEWRDTDSDGIGDNKDPDADGDAILNIDEIKEYGSNPLAVDSDDDGVGDKQEVMAGTNPNKTDSDGDGVEDAKDRYPLDISRSGASLLDSVVGLFNSKNAPYLIFGAPIALLILFLFLRRRRD